MTSAAACLATAGKALCAHTVTSKAEACAILPIISNIGLSSSRDWSCGMIPTVAYRVRLKNPMCHAMTLSFLPRNVSNKLPYGRIGGSGRQPASWQCDGCRPRAQLVRWLLFTLDRRGRRRTKSLAAFVEMKRIVSCRLVGRAAGVQ